MGENRKTALLRQTVREWFGAEDFEVIAKTGMMWCGWDADSQVYLIRLPSGETRLVVEDPGPDTGPDTNITEMLEERMRTYMQAAHDTARFLVKWRGRPAPVIRDMTDEEAAAIINGGDDDQDD